MRVGVGVGVAVGPGVGVYNGVGVGVGKAVAVGTNVGVGEAVGDGRGVGVGDISTVKFLVAKLPLSDLAYTVVRPGLRYGTSTLLSKLPFGFMYIQLEVLISTSPIVISAMHS